MAAEQGISLINIVPSIAVHDHIDLGQYMKVIVGFLSPDVFFDQLAFIHENVMSRASRCLQYLIHVGERLDQEPSRTGSRVHESFTVLRVGGFHDVVDQLTGRRMVPDGPRLSIAHLRPLSGWRHRHRRRYRSTCWSPPRRVF